MKKLVWLALCCMVSLALLAGGAWGAEFCVDPGGGGTHTSLQAALTTAKSNGADDTIKVVQGTYTGNFTYSSSEGKSITLLGGYTTGCASRVVDPVNTILDGGTTGRVLLLYDGNGGSIEVDGFAIQNGNFIGGYGGGVFAKSYSESDTAGTVTLLNNTITGNSAQYNGGGVYAQSSSWSGTAGTVTLLNNTITGNNADQSGGGVYAESYSSSGPAGTVTLLNNTITGNNGDYGGGVFAMSDSDSGAAGTITLINNTITGNNADAYGGGAYPYVYGHPDGIANCYNNIIWGNTAPIGGDIYWGGFGTFSGYNNDYTTMGGTWTNSDNNINTNPLFADPDYGDYRLRSGSPCKDAGTNSVPSPGLPATDFEGDPRIIDGTVDIGADEVSILTTCVSDVTGLQNALTAAQTNGKGDVIMVVQGLYVENFIYDSSEGKSITLLAGYIPGCASRVWNPANTVLDGGGTNRVLAFSNTNGGGITVQGFTIQNGNVGSGNGGGVYANSHSASGTAGNVYLGYNIITGNSTQRNGGGAAAYSYTTSGAAGDVVLANNIATGNAADGNGGGIDTASFATSGGTAGTITVTSNTVSGNTAANGGGTYFDVHGSSGTVNCYNNIIWGNTAPTGGDIYLAGSGTFNGYNNDYAAMSGTWTNSDHNITADPLFVGAGDYHLSSASPCIDAGTVGAPGLPATDFEGDNRTIGPASDMGADELIGSPVDGAIFAGCSLINKYQPSFQWRFTETFKSLTIYFSTSPTDFSTKGILIAKAKVKGTMSSYIPSSGVWKKIFTAGWNGGAIRNIYWKVIGIRTNKSTVSSAVWGFSVDAPYPPEILAPAIFAQLHAATPPTFGFDTMCNIKFRLEISSVSNFSDPKKIKAFTYSVKNPNLVPIFQKALSAGQWKAVQKLIGIGTGYFRIRAWDKIKRETASEETRSFHITSP